MVRNEWERIVPELVPSVNSELNGKNVYFKCFQAKSLSFILVFGKCSIDHMTELNFKEY